jgi:acyl-coenzyme A thioesterase PaaI-like protein
MWDEHNVTRTSNLPHKALFFPLQEDVQIEAQVLKAGRNLAVATARVRRIPDGLLLAEGRHTKFIASIPSSKL